MILVKIIKGSDWYKDKIGEEFYVKPYNVSYYYPVNQAIAGLYKIAQDDCEIILKGEMKFFNDKEKAE